MKSLRRYILSRYGASLILYAVVGVPAIVVDIALALRLVDWLAEWLPPWLNLVVLGLLSTTVGLFLLGLNQWQNRWIVRDATKHDH